MDGSGMLVGDPVGPARLGPGSEFTMGMRQVGRRYRSVSRVVEFEEGRRIAWASTGVWRGRTVVGGQRWRHHVTPVDGGTRVLLSYVWGHARAPLLTVWLPGYPARRRSVLPRSLALLAAAVGDAPAPEPSRPDTPSATGTSGSRRLR